MRRRKDEPLPQTFESKGHGIKVTITLAPKGHLFDELDLWDDEPDWGDDPRYDPELSADQARWVPPLDPPAPVVKSPLEQAHDLATRRR